MIDKWLKARVLEEGALRRSETGTPQGGVISPMLSNIFLHHVLDEWFEREAKPRLRGSCQLVRFADDFVMAFEDPRSGRRMLDVLGKRLGRYGLTLHATKTRYVDFRPKRPRGHDPDTTFDFLGFTHVWGRSRRGRNVVRQITAKDRFTRAVRAVLEWCKANLHRPARRAATPPCTGDPGPLRLLRSDGEQQTSQRVPLLGHTPLAQGARAPQPRGARDLRSHEGASEPLPSAASHGRALDLYRLSETGM